MSINDVPIGPIRLEEMAHKIDAAAVSEYSLVWREGFEEWRPLATVPELMALLHERRHSGPPARSSFSSMPPFVETRASLAEPSPPAAVPAPPSSFPNVSSPAADDEIAPLADALQPELSDAGLSDMSQPPAPIGPEAVFGSSPQLGSYSGLPPTPDSDVSVPPVPPEPAAATAEPKRGLSLGVLALIIAVAVFSGVAAFLAFERFGDELMKQWVMMSESVSGAKPAPKRTPVATPEPTPEPEPELAAAAEPVAVEESAGEEGVEEDAAEAVEDTALAEGDEAPAEDAEAEAAPIVPPPDPHDNAAKMEPLATAQPKVRRKPRPKPLAAPAEPDSDLSAADQKLLDEFGSSGDAAAAKIDVKESGGTQSDNPPLDARAVSSTVNANKPKLQRCYERAIRGQQSPPAVRLDISVMVAASGRVKSVSSQGDGPGGLAACVEASVRRWRFPASAEGGPARFPVVFSAN